MFLEQCFQRIAEERMADVPILNPRLRVKAVGFRPWQDLRLGVLITPWFINLVLLSDAPDAERWPGVASGASISVALPAGQFDFLLGEAAPLGRYLACSLFSPVLEFEDQAAAEAVAREVMQGLFAEAQHETVAVGTPAGATPLSRRGFLRGEFGRGTQA